MIIYKIENIINNKIYIGQTVKSLNVRWNNHKADARTRPGKCSKLHRAMNKYGFENFEMKPLAVCNTIGELNFLEEALIKKYDTINSGYNIKFGGDNRFHSEETKLKIGSKHKGKKISEEQKNILKTFRAGKRQSLETRKKISESNIGRKNSAQSIEKQRQTVLNNRENLHNSILTFEKVKQIKNLINSYTDNQLSLMFGISRRHMNDIRNGKRWGDVR